MYRAIPKADGTPGVPEQFHKQKPAFTAGRLPATPHCDELTRRELEVLTLVAEGLTNNQVAERLFLSPVTVNRHLTSIYSKLDVRCRCAATRFALERGFLSISSSSEENPR